MAHFLDQLDLTPNAIERARRSLPPGSYVDLSSSNPTRQGLLFPPAILREAADGYWDARVYDPSPHGALPARHAIAAYYGKRGAPIDVERIFITASTSEAYSLLFSMLCEPGDNVLSPDVGYPLIDLFAALQGIEVRPYRLDPAHGWGIDWEDAGRQADARTRAMLVISPHNPTGAVVASLAGADVLPAGVPIVCDEVFSSMPYAVGNIPVPASSRPLVLLNGISKMFALPDLKLGWVAMNAPAAAHFAERFELLNDTFLGANALTQHMLPGLFARGEPFAADMRARIRVNLDLAIALLGASPRISVDRPDGGYYLLPTVDGWDDDESLVLTLLEHGVFVHPGHFYNCPPRDPVRIMLSCLSAPHELRLGLSRILAVLAAR